MPYHLKGQVQHYNWGGYTFIPDLLQEENPAHQPFAEYWMGAHPKAPSNVWIDEQQAVLLNELIESNPVKYLGKYTSSHFGRLPYLFKVLDVREMLSIQVHPSKAEAEKGFARENTKDIPLDSPQRNYKDDNHKPEMMVALSPFYLLHGFRPEHELIKILNTTPELRSLLTLFEQKGYEGIYSYVMTIPQKQVNEILQPLLSRLLPLYKQEKLDKNDPGFWAARALESGLTSMDQIDRGIFAIYFLNLVSLKPGEATFQDAGTLHAYLEGQNMELMANSDNVLRGGLTSKHVDVKELLKHTNFEGGTPHILKGTPAGKNEQTFPCPASDFSLNKIKLSKKDTLKGQAGSIEIWFVFFGKVLIGSGEKLPLSRGQAILFTAGEKYVVDTLEETLIYKASVPVGQGHVI